MPNRARFMHASSLRRQTVVRRGRRMGSDIRVASFESSVDGPPASPRDYATLSAGWGAALATLLLAARDKGEEPVRPAEVVPLGLATFALSKLVAKEKVDKRGREPFVEEAGGRGGARRARAVPRGRRGGEGGGGGGGGRAWSERGTAAARGRPKGRGMRYA